MSWCSARFLIVAWLAGAAFIVPAEAVTIFERGKTEPTRGRLVRQTSEAVTIEEALPDGSLRERSVPRTQIEDLIDPVSTERLEALAPSQPQAYRNYAEELAEKRVDPDARAAAIRLYLIAAWLDPENLAKSSLLGMTALARSAEEERAFRALAYLYDPDHDRRLLRPVEPAAPGEASEARQSLARAVRLRRQGNRRAAALQMGRPGVREELQKHRELLTYEEFSQPGLSPSLLRKLVALELALESGEAASGEGTVAWSQAFPSGARPVPALSLKTLTEFDPSACVYRNGMWTTP